MSAGPDRDRVGLPAPWRGRSAALLSPIVLAASLWVVRAWYAGPHFVFLLWNLLLAVIPWAAAQTLVSARSRIVVAASAAAWLLFLPNAPYLVTDLMHLKARPPVPLGFDVMLLASFALAGCALGWASLELVHRRLRRALGPARGGVAIGLAIALSGFGVYLGRFQRWNSWDLLTRPLELLSAVAAALRSPQALAFSALFAAFVGAGYLLFASRGDGREGRASD